MYKRRYGRRHHGFRYQNNPSAFIDPGHGGLLTGFLSGHGGDSHGGMLTNWITKKIAGERRSIYKPGDRLDTKEIVSDDGSYDMTKKRGNFI